MRQLSLVLLGSSLLAAGCVNRGTGNVDSAESAIDSSDGVSAEGNVMMAAVDGADMTGLVALTGDQVAAKIAANVAARWNPSGCATVTQTGANLAITYDDCSGPRGLVHVTGELDLAVSVALDGTISVHATASDLQVNNASLSISADGTYATSGTSHTLTVQSSGDGTGPRGNDITHDGQYTITWDTSSQCGSIAGHWSTELSNATTSATRSNDVSLMKCATGCPTGTVTHHFLGGQSLTVTFDGTATASWSTSGGKTGTIALSCQ